MLKKIVLLLVVLSFTLYAPSQVSKTVNVTAGGLSAALTHAELITVTNLTVTGTIDARDFVILRDSATALAIINLSEASIAAYTGTMGTVNIFFTSSHFYPANEIPWGAFMSLLPSRKITSISMPLSVTSIDVGAFSRCSGLTAISIPSTVTSIGACAFQFCTGLTSIIIPWSVTEIKAETFDGCTGLTSITIPSSVTAIGEYAFWGAGLTSINIPSSVLSIATTAFRNCADLISINIPLGITSIGIKAFYYCTSLTSITIPSSVTSIDIMAFEGCVGLTSITIPSSVSFIGSYAFWGCNLNSIYENSTLPPDVSWVSNVFNGINQSTCTLYVPTGSKSAYQAADQWKNFTNIVEMTTALQTIPNAELSIYPNPVTDSFRIGGYDGSVLIIIMDLNGKALLKKQVNANEEININSFSKGIYMVEINAGNGLILKKIIKE